MLFLGGCSSARTDANDVKLADSANSSAAADSNDATSSNNDATSPESSTATTTVPTASDAQFKQLFDARASDVPVTGSGTVTKLLADDNDGSRHQRFIVKLSSGQTLLIAHNIDIAPRVEPLQVGSVVQFSGEYIYNKEGGFVHWTHHDPKGSHSAGYLEVNGKRCS